MFIYPTYQVKQIIHNSISFTDGEIFLANSQTITCNPLQSSTTTTTTIISAPINITTPNTMPKYPNTQPNPTSLVIQMALYETVRLTIMMNAVVCRLIPWIGVCVCVCVCDGITASIARGRTRWRRQYVGRVVKLYR